MTPSENNMINGLKKGDAKAFAWIYNLYYNRLLYFAKQLIADEQEAQDIISGVFIKLWHKRADFDNLPGIRAFLYIAVRNACFDFLKYSKRLATRQKDFLYWAEDKEEEVLHLMLKAELLQEIVTEIEKLPPQYQAVCKLSFFEGLTNDEIAEKLQLSVKTIRNIKAMAVNEIKTVFLKRKLFLLAAAFSGCFYH
ncbi:MAG TPA: RNA polymerase sigma-70 factor [Mucilaginibacter sp.]